MIAVGVLVSDPAGLTKRGVWVEASEACGAGLASTRWPRARAISVRTLTSDEQDPLVEAANHGDLRLLLLLLVLCVLCLLLGLLGVLALGGGRLGWLGWVLALCLCHRGR